ncbi:hypothetical protein PRZ48_001472 [Zasmidium cellare]|uniref:Uncharacterized protein n=1 Tax=Zasmidium cellare TaxID=395010 RepID=A0ABR0F1J9_ZASCE|nr:hypothetical protein PRZ48_001472 [Zasmidium cellare]
MSSSRLNSLDDSPVHHERHALPPSVEAKRAQRASSSSPSRPTHLSPPPLHHRAGADELLVGPSNTSLASQPYYDAASFIGTCIEVELTEGQEEEDVPLFTRPDFGGHGSVEQVEDVGAASPKQGKRKASQRMSTTFESVVGLGRTFKRRVSSLWSGKEGGSKRKDSRWMSLEGGQWTEQVGELGSRPPVFGVAGPAGRNNPYPSRPWFVNARAAELSRRTSGHWTPFESDGRSTRGLLEEEVGSPRTRRSVSEQSFHTARMESLERTVARVMGGEGTAVAVTAVAGPEDDETPQAAKPRGESMVETGYTLAHHLENAQKNGRFDQDRIARRFAGEENGAAQEHTVESPAVEEENLHGGRDQAVHSTEELIESNNRKNSTIWSFFTRGRQSSQPPEPRPSVSAVEQEEQERPRSSFGAELARVAGAVGTSMSQAPVMF